MSKRKAPKHPGRTSVERRILDYVGSGVTRPRAKASTLEKMVNDGLLTPIYTCLAVDYEMPIAVHIQWCNYWASRPDVEMHDDL
jgi:hypothetical protein